MKVSLFDKLQEKVRCTCNCFVTPDVFKNVLSLKCFFNLIFHFPFTNKLHDNNNIPKVDELGHLRNVPFQLCYASELIYPFIGPLSLELLVNISFQLKCFLFFYYSLFV